MCGSSCYASACRFGQLDVSAGDLLVCIPTSLPISFSVHVYMLTPTVLALLHAKMPGVSAAVQLFVCVFLLALPAHVVSLWPIPRSLQTGSTPLTLAPDFTIVNLPNAPADLAGAVARTLAHIKTDRLQRLVVGRAAADRAAVQHARQLPSLHLSVPAGVRVERIADEAVKPLAARREEYVLRVPADGSPATLAANSSLGLLRGLTTFEQLWYDLDGAATYTLEAPISVVDSPAFVSYIALRVV